MFDESTTVVENSMQMLEIMSQNDLLEEAKDYYGEEQGDKISTSDGHISPRVKWNGENLEEMVAQR